MKKIIAVSALAVAGMFSAQTLANESKTGFYMTGRRELPFYLFPTSVLSKVKESGRTDTKVAMTMIRYSVAVLRPVMIFIRNSVFRFVQNWSFMLVEMLTRNIIFIKTTGRVVT
ncbi:Putative peptide transport periplasmic protein [Escherichia coli]|uniref:Peptide transport periplasmic protein n=1 Tax=Escherichia coli TaxID=562 RepID=A0A376Y7Z7_ECOLX|nr:Putative peptide transport periplasmic protein [Escherichia coli]